MWLDELEIQELLDELQLEKESYGWNDRFGQRFFTDNFKYKNIYDELGGDVALYSDLIICMADGYTNAIYKDAEGIFYASDEDIAKELNMPLSYTKGVLKLLIKKGVLAKLTSAWSRNKGHYYYVVNPLYMSSTPYLNWISYFSFYKQINPLVEDSVDEQMQEKKENYLFSKNRQMWCVENEN